MKKKFRSEKRQAPAPSPQASPWIYLVLFLATFAAYSQVRHFDFVNYDDPLYVSRNVHLRDGISLAGLKWAFTSGEGANWFPVTRLSHLLDVQLFGLQSGWHHLVNVLIHALATLLLFAFLYRATRARWPSAFVAFLFALHPLHVESVAWISERKDVLCAFFWMLTLWAWVRYTDEAASAGLLSRDREKLRKNGLAGQRPTPHAWKVFRNQCGVGLWPAPLQAQTARPPHGLGRYGQVLIAFCLGLMSKPMIVSLPLLLVLLDVWPLGRYRSLPRKQLIREKIPFFALSAAAAIVTYVVQQSGGAVRTFSAVPFGLRVENGLISCLVYIAKLFWPSGLAVFYPYPAGVPIGQALLAALVLAGISVAVVRLFFRYPYLTVGWFWYLVTLAPVLGIVQVGGQARADRYTYVPMIGLAIMLAWGGADLLASRPRIKPLITAAAVAACLGCAVLTGLQVRYWSDSVSLFQHTVDVTERNDLAQHNLGNALLEVPGRLPDAIGHLQAALRINPDSASTHTDLGNALSKLSDRLPDRLPDAVAEYRAAVHINPDLPIPHANLASALLRVPGGIPESITESQTALRLDPDLAEAHNTLASALANSGRMPEAVVQFREAVRLDPDNARFHDNLSTALSNDPSKNEADLALALAKTPGKLPDAIAHFEAALRLNPRNAEAHNNLGFALTSFPNRLPEAISHFQAALRINPDYADAHYNLGVALANLGRTAEAIQQFEAADRLKPDPELEQLIRRLKSS